MGRRAIIIVLDGWEPATPPTPQTSVMRGQTLFLPS